MLLRQSQTLLVFKTKNKITIKVKIKYISSEKGNNFYKRFFHHRKTSSRLRLLIMTWAAFTFKKGQNAQTMTKE